LSGEGAEEEAGDVGFACVGAGAGDEVVHAAGADGGGAGVGKGGEVRSGK
jgi:hypothetical protein